VKEEAIGNRSLVVIYLHSPLHHQAIDMCRRLIQPPMLEFLQQDHITAIGSSIHTSQGSQLAQQLGAACFPLLAMLQPGNSTSAGFQLVFRAEGPALLKMTMSQLLPFLQATYQRHQSVVAEHETRRALRQQESELRRQQDEEYLESLRSDQERERQRQEEREREEQKIREEDEKKQLEEQAEQERLAIAMSLLRPPPVAGGARIRFQLPNGKKLDRRFHDDETIASLKAFLILHFAEQNPAIRNIALSTNFPKRTFDDDQKTLKESDLCPQSVLMVQDLDA